jgi:anti-sigma factor RsiW
MNCRELTDFLMAYLDEELTPTQHAAFEEHMAICPPCVVYLDSYRETVRLGKEVCARDESPVPDDVPEVLIEAILAARKR